MPTSSIMLNDVNLGICAQSKTDSLFANFIHGKSVSTTAMKLPQMPLYRHAGVLESAPKSATDLALVGWIFVEGVGSGSVFLISSPPGRSEASSGLVYPCLVMT